jgi:transposase
VPPLSNREIGDCERELRRLGADHPYLPLLITCPGIAWILAFTIASEIGDIARFRTPTKLVGYTGLTPKVEQSGESDRRGPLRKNGPNHLRWALVESAHTASRHPLYQPILERTRARHGRKRGSKLAALTIARKLTEAIWHMLTNDQPFAPAGARTSLAA